MVEGEDRRAGHGMRHCVTESGVGLGTAMHALQLQEHQSSAPEQGSCWGPWGKEQMLLI